MVLLTPHAFAEMLALLRDHPRVSLGKTTQLTVSSAPWVPSLAAELLKTGEIELKLIANTARPVFIAEQWIFQNHTFQCSVLPKQYHQIFQGTIKLTRTEVPRFLSQEWPHILGSGRAQANFRLEDFTLQSGAPRFSLQLKGGIAQLEAVLKCDYRAMSFTIGSSAAGGSILETFWLPDPDSPTQYSTRDLEAEQSALNRLRAVGFTGPDPQGGFRLVGQNTVLNFFAREFPRWRETWNITMEERLEWSARQHLERVEPTFQITSSGVQWFDLSVSYSSQSGTQFSPAEIQRLILSGQRYTKMKNGKFALLDTGAIEELQETLLDCSPQQHANGYRLRSNQAGFLEATLRDQGWKAQAPAGWRERTTAHTGEAQLDCPRLGNLDAVLRPYQKHGVAWLEFLRRNNFGGILADEMGLGKTLQTLAFIKSIIERRRGLPTLVICPTSLVWNWRAEAQKFTPELKVLTLHGNERHGDFQAISQFDLVLTSYALMRRDSEHYRNIQFDTLALDEAQHIKNRQTQNAQAVKNILAHHRLVLTGTPLENSVFDLWSIFDFLMPGYLGAAQDFRERYELPISQHHDAGAQARLARRLRPFILRRTKQQVAPEIPQKLENVIYCELSEQQRTVYEQLMDASRREIMNAVGADGATKTRIVVLNALLRLRQVCCDLRLLKLDSTLPENTSGKIDAFEELLEESLDGGHRILVFSQFVSMLTLLREHLEKRETAYCYLDGSTDNRSEVVSNFQRNTEIPVFLISLKAGGLGLNLTGADTVIHFDPWWNPAIEDQATDRAHRIGQQRVVNSYKLIARGTVEEKILSLQNKKRDLLKVALGSEQQFTDKLSWDELQELLT